MPGWRREALHKFNYVSNMKEGFERRGIRLHIFGKRWWEMASFGQIRQLTVFGEMESLSWKQINVAKYHFAFNNRSFMTQFHPNLVLMDFLSVVQI